MLLLILVALINYAGLSHQFQNIELECWSGAPDLCSCKGGQIVSCNGWSGPFPLNITSLTITETGYLTLNKLQLPQYTSLTHLNLTNNNLTVTSLTCDEPHHNIKVLDLSRNNLVSLYGIQTCFPNLHQLVVSNNHIDALSPTSFHHMSYLEVLDASNNDLKVIPAGTLSGLESLRHLDLSYNSLSTLSSAWLPSVLNKLLIHDNDIRQIEIHAPVTIHYLDISNNKIENLHPLHLIRSIQHLNLAGNAVSTLHIKRQDQLKWLNISNNPLKLKGETLRYLVALEKIYIQDIPTLDVLPDDMLKGSTRVNTVIISDNKYLKAVGSRTFADLPNLTHLYLNNNRLHSLPRTFLDGIPQLAVIDLHNNPWECDCRLWWMFSFLERNRDMKILNFNKTDCKSMKTNVKNMYEEIKSLNCTPVSLIEVRFNNPVGVGENVLFESEAFGTPKPAITWVTPENYVFHWEPGKSQYEVYSSMYYNHPNHHDSRMKPLPDHQLSKFQVRKLEPT